MERLKAGRSETVAILDCYTIEPSGLGVPPYLSAYVRNAFSALSAAFPGAMVRYLTIDDVRWCLNGGRALTPPPLSDSFTYSASANRANAIEILCDASIVVTIAGDAVPSGHLHAKNGSVEEIARAVAHMRGGGRVLLGPLAGQVAREPTQLVGLFDALHTHTITSANLLAGSRTAASFERMRADRGSYASLVEQLDWCPIAEIELYRGCTRRRLCSFCNEPVKAPVVRFRTVEEVLEEVDRLYAAGVSNFRLGQQTCFFSYFNRDLTQIERLLAGIRERCPELEVLHIDNADPLTVASRVGGKIAKLVARYCTEGNCAPMGVESFDPVVVRRNVLTCTPELLIRAIEHVNAAGADRGPLGLPRLLPGLNLVYGLPGETEHTHAANLKWLAQILDSGLLCHRTNVRQARAYPGTPLTKMQMEEPLPSRESFRKWKAEIDTIWDVPMKRRVYPLGQRLRDLRSFFVTSRGTWFRRLGSCPIQVVERGAVVPLHTSTDLTVRDHGPRFIYGERHAV